MTAVETTATNYGKFHREGVLVDQVFVLMSDWNSPKDPVPNYGAPPGQCLDFNNRRAKPRVLLVAVEELVLPDCEYGMGYDVVRCEVHGQDQRLWRGDIS